MLLLLTLSRLLLSLLLRLLPLLLLLALALVVLLLLIQAGLQKKREEHMKRCKPEPRGASLKHILRLHRYMDIYADAGLQMFQNIDKLEILDLLTGCRTGSWPAAMPEIPADLVVECLCVSTDEEQSHITGGEFLTANKPAGFG